MTSLCRHLEIFCETRCNLQRDVNVNKYFNYAA